MMPGLAPEQEVRQQIDAMLGASPDITAARIAEDLESDLEQFTEIASDLTAASASSEES